jgi:hypothetical protein
MSFDRFGSLAGPGRADEMVQARLDRLRELLALWERLKMHRSPHVGIRRNRRLLVWTETPEQIGSGENDERESEDRYSRPYVSFRLACGFLCEFVTHWIHLRILEIIV